MTDQSDFTIYLLHYDHKLGRVHHYLGITRSERLQTRLDEHASKVGSRLTHQLASLNQRFYVARLWTNASPALEKRLKASANLKRSCKICATGQLDTEMQCVEIKPKAQNKPPLLNVDFSPRGGNVHPS